jgi:PQQ-dependent dehydrogenase (methanol/ethanol family)
MPVSAPHSLSSKQYELITSFIIAENHFLLIPGPHGGGRNAFIFADRSTNTEAEGQTIPFTGPDKPIVLGTASAVAPTDDDLATPAAADWPLYNRDYQGQRYSALKQITALNAGQLGATCLFQAGEIGAFQTSPVIFRGVIFITTPFSTYAINGATCRLLWAYRYPADQSGPSNVNRGVAVYHGKVFRVTPNGHLLALDMTTGKLLWDVLTIDVRRGQWLSAAPTAYDGRVYIGTAGAEFGAIGQVFGFDSETGLLDWTFSTVPRPGEPGSETWVKGAEHGGGTIWSTLTVVPATGELLVSVGNPAPDFDGAARPGDNLYTNSVVALNHRSGALDWWVQQVSHDVHDWDTAAAPVAYRQGTHSYIAVASKNGLLYIYEASNRALIATAEVTRRLNTEAPITASGTHHCPGWLGGVEWNGPAYSPSEKVLFVNAVDWCGTTKLLGSPHVDGSPDVGGYSVPDPVETARGWTRALDSVTGQVRWSKQARTPMTAGVTSTAGGVVFTGEVGGDFIVLSAKDGSELYRFNTGGSIAGGISTYSVDGRQYVAVASGNASRMLWATAGAPTLVVFALRYRGVSN